MSDRNNGFENLENDVLFSMLSSPGDLDLGSGMSMEDIMIERIALQKVKDNLDQTTGAPANVRYAVGAAQSPEDKLATLQQFYPDAMPVEILDPDLGAQEYGRGNYVFTNPDTGKLTLFDEFNPKFLGIPIPTGRDIFLDAGPEVAETVGSIGGFIGGGIGGAYASPFTGGVVNPVTGAIVGEGLGSASARELYIGIADIFGDTIDTRSLGQRGTDFTTTAVFNAAAGPIISKTFQGIKYVAGQPFRYISGGTSKTAKENAKAFDSVGITNPTPGQITENPSLLLIEETLAGMPASTRTMYNNAKQTVAQIDAYAKDLAGRYGGVRTTDEAATELMQGARRARQVYNNKVTSLYNQVDEFMPSNLSSPAENTKQFVNKYLPASKTETGQKTLGPVMELAAKVLADADAGVLTYNNLKQFRSFLRENLSSATAAGGRLDSNGVKMKELYGYITKDLDALVASSPSPRAGTLYRQANEFVAENTSKQGGMTYVDNILAKGEVEANKALKYVLSGAQDGGESLLKLKNILDPDEFNVISGYILGRMGVPTPGISSAAELGAEGVIKQGSEYIAEQGFSPRTFITNWNRLSKEAKEALFKGTEHEKLIPELDNLVQVIDSVGKSAEKMANPSGTARVLTTMSYFTAGADALGKIPGSEGFEFGLSALLMPYGGAKLFTNADYVKWLTEGIEIAAYNPNSFGQHARRLYMIYEANPEIRDEIRAVTEGLQHDTIEPIENQNAENVPPATTAAPNEQAFREVTGAEVAGKLLPDIELAEQITEFSPPQVSDPEIIMSPTILPDEADREIAMRQQAGGIGSLV
jgi:hypothetical protein|tara:strand:- start:1186 stop:3633 length:2448 start_codon:yes stop_codon:yes gene_type:complete